jgi:DNA replication and repair protein RecF
MLTNIRLQHFRSYQDATFAFGEGVNVVVGPNGSGKTNLLEAVLVLLRGASFRVGDEGLVQHGSDWARLDTSTSDGHERTVKLQVDGRDRKTYVFDEKPYRRLPAGHTLPVVLFEPEHLALVSGVPETRRSYLDDILEQTKPGYASFRKNYRRVVSQRNALLKAALHRPQDFFPWELRLSELGAVIHRARRDLVVQLNRDIAGLYSTLAGGKGTLALDYTGRFAAETYETQLLQTLEKKRPDDIARGFTAYGPHREDLTVFFDGKPATQVMSRGETRTSVLALKILELQTIERLLGQTPTLLLDDVFSELDTTRRAALTTYLTPYQTFLTTTNADTVTKFPSTNTLLIPQQ